MKVGKKDIKSVCYNKSDSDEKLEADITIVRLYPRSKKILGRENHVNCFFVKTSSRCFEVSSRVQVCSSSFELELTIHTSCFL
ncbi:hypothetical protein AT705_19310 [Pseudoalteromonas rubra]|uniref:Uncharacterized protein n=1 Tax=Pseudoalteromonas rubra TaxID=43658 RepID=A0A0U3GX78_9GAMM|nr:hypothetical protein AT705_19310 [Pseudoalteromonas rubra]